MTSLSALEDHASVRAAWQHAIDAARAHIQADAVLVVAASAGTWSETGIRVAVGERVTLFSQGVVWLARAHGIGFEGNAALWYRVGDGPVERAGTRTTSFTAKHAGALRLAARPPGAWLEHPESISAMDSWAAAEGGFAVAAILWRGAVTAGLAVLAAADASGFAAIEQARRASASPAPSGWHAHPVIGPSTIFTEGPQEGHGHGITCHCERDVGILQYPVDVPLDASTRLNWSWQMRRLPSAVAENQMPTHDYLSIAVEFENGLDLTYLWSSSLAVGTHFRCPLPWWDQRETHWVARSGSAEIGRWLDEQRPILEDYRIAIGGPDPSRIVAVWLIAVSLFQRDLGECAYAGITLSDAAGALATVL